MVDALSIYLTLKFQSVHIYLSTHLPNFSLFISIYLVAAAAGRW